VVLCVAIVPTALMFLGSMVALAFGRRTGYLAGIAIHAVIVASLSFLGPVAVAIGHADSSTVLTVLMLLAAYRRRWAAVAGAALRRLLPAFGWRASSWCSVFR
jgi:hypothetical protein